MLYSTWGTPRSKYINYYKLIFNSLLHKKNEGHTLLPNKIANLDIYEIIIYTFIEYISINKLLPDLSFNYLSDNIRCPKCSYGNISSSNAPISKDLKEEIAELINEGYSNEEIFDLMEKRYGDYVILKTDLEDNKTLFLAPLMILIISILLVTTYTIKKSK